MKHPISNPVVFPRSQLARRLRSLLSGALLLLGSLAAASAQELHRFAYEKAEMGLPFRITLYAPDEATARAATDAAFARIAELNAIFTDYDDASELSRLSRTAGEGRAVPVSRDLWAVLSRAHALAEQTEGAFDITCGPLVNLWRRARRKQELPAADLIAEMKARVGFRHMQLDPAARTVTLLLPEMRLDCGAIAKNYAVDQALALLTARGLTRALVAGSGDMAAGDPPPGLPGWRIEVAALDAPGAPPPQIIHIAHRGIATSGDIYQRVEIAGKRYSHIVDPHTGYGLTDHGLVTVLAPDCTTACLATAVSVLGPTRGLALIEAHPGTAARIARKPGDQVEFLTSSRWPR